MHTEYRKEYSKYLDREMEFKVYGHDGKPCLVFPPQDGKFTDYENFKMVETLSDYIEQGKLRLFCVDSVDRESWSDKEGNPRYRAEMQEKWFNYITNEIVPFIQNYTGRNDLMVNRLQHGRNSCRNFFFP